MVFAYTTIIELDDRSFNSDVPDAVQRLVVQYISTMHPKEPGTEQEFSHELCDRVGVQRARHWTESEEPDQPAEGMIRIWVEGGPETYNYIRNDREMTITFWG